MRRSSRALVLVALAIVASGCFDNTTAPTTAPTTTATTTATPTTTPPLPAVWTAACHGTLVASTPGAVASNSVTELSGIAASRRNANVWWVHNDSGDTARVFAVGDTGRDLGTYTLSGASATDWEDIAVGPGPKTGVNYLYAADIGDNGKTRRSVGAYRVPEPAVDAATATRTAQTITGVDALTFTYPDGPHDAETFFVDPTSGEAFIVTKELSGASQVFRAPANLPAGSTTTLTQVATLALGLAGLATGGDVTPAGDVVALRTYGTVLLYPRATGTSLGAAFSKKPCAGQAAVERQGEAIGFTRDGRGYVTSTEGAHPPLHRFVAP